MQIPVLSTHICSHLWDYTCASTSVQQQLIFPVICLKFPYHLLFHHLCELSLPSIWTYTFHKLLESFCDATFTSSSPSALGHLQDFIYYVYTFYSRFHLCHRSPQVHYLLVSISFPLDFSFRILMTLQ